MSMKQQSNMTQNQNTKLYKHTNKKRDKLDLQGKKQDARSKNQLQGHAYNLTCRGCGKADETQIHVMTECECLHENNSTKMETDELFDDTAGKIELQNTANKIKKIMERLKKSDAPPTQGRERLADAGICSTEID